MRKNIFENLTDLENQMKALQRMFILTSSQKERKIFMREIFVIQKKISALKGGEKIL